MLRRLISPCFLVRYCLLLKKETVITQRTHAIRHMVPLAFLSHN